LALRCDGLIEFRIGDPPADIRVIRFSGVRAGRVGQFVQDQLIEAQLPLRRFSAEYAVNFGRDPRMVYWIGRRDFMFPG
jgi:hypothetical protein